MINLKPFQKGVVTNALEIFQYVANQLQQVTKDVERKAIVSHNGGILIKAPTGSGKTLIAGDIANQFSTTEKVVWFWFAPFKGLVGQTESSLRDQFPTLRIRSLREDRQAVEARSGDVWVSTWQAVATKDTEGRKIRTDSELNPSLDGMLRQLRTEGFAIGVIVDEAHHGFGHGTQALKFYSDSLRPQFTLLLTATPDDADAEAFKRAAGFQRLHPITISRDDAVAEGLVKPGVRSIAFVATEQDQAQRVNFETTALREGGQMHRLIKAGLSTAGIDLVPLMLVQVDSSANSVERVKATLIEQGFRAEQIATHTAAEPDADLLALAVDETKEVLIFKMAVALGFDAPRAFTLVSMRGIVDADFGTQIVGRIMRVHRRCQGRELPPMLQNAYVFLADCEVQKGLSEAAQKVNQIKTELAKVSPYTVVVRVAGENQLQIVKNGQTYLLPERQQLPVEIEGTSIDGTPLQANQVRSIPQPSLFDGIDFEPAASTAGGDSQPLSPSTGLYVYKLKAGFPSTFLTQRMIVGVDDEGMAGGIAESIQLSNSVLAEGKRQAVALMRVEQEVFEHKEVSRTKIQAELDLRETELLAQRMLFNMGTVDPRDLHNKLLARLKAEYRAQGDELAENEEQLEYALDLILVQFPELLREARKTCLAKYTEVVNAAPLPLQVVSNVPLELSPKNLYGIYPSDMNGWEMAFTHWLDNTEDGLVDWWHRNPPWKTWSVAVVLPNGHLFFPDFLISLNGRKTPDSILLADTKRAINDDENSLEKAVTDHQCYGRTAILFYEQAKRWKLVQYDEARDKNVVGELFDLNAAREF